MKRSILLIIIVLSSVFGLCSQDTAMLVYIKERSLISTGGSDVYVFKDTTYVVSVASVIVGAKSETDCQKIGAAKAKKEMLSFVNGSNITSCTELSVNECVVECVGVQEFEAAQAYKEIIKEEVTGHVNGVRPLGWWYSEDGSVYYYGIYKIIKQI